MIPPLYRLYRWSLRDNRRRHLLVRRVLSALFFVVTGLRVQQPPQRRLPVYVLPALAEPVALFIARHFDGGWRRVAAWQVQDAQRPPPARQRVLTSALTIVALVVALIAPATSSAAVPHVASTAHAADQHDAVAQLPVSVAKGPTRLAALAATVVLEVRTGGSDTNGGGFNSAASGTDWSQQDAAQYSVTDGVTTSGSANVTSATASFGTDVVGNLIYIQGGTGSVTAVWRQINSRTNSTTIALDASLSTSSTGVTLKIGGAFASVGQAAAVISVAGQKIYVKSGSYTVTSASTNVSGGCVSINIPILLEGYQTTRGDLGTAPVFTASGISTFTMFIGGVAGQRYRNLEVDGASLTSSRGFTMRGSIEKCKAANCTNNGFVSSTSCMMSGCIATGCSTQPAFSFPSGTPQGAWDCVAYDNTVTGFSNVGQAVLVRCIADSNSGASSDGFSSSSTDTAYVNCVAYNSGRDGIRSTSTNLTCQNCIVEGNAGYGINLPSNTNNGFFYKCAGYNNTSGNVNLGTGSGVVNEGFVTGSGSFFTNAASGDFSLNNTAGGGASARAAGFPGTLRYGGTGYLDIGALQHQDADSSSGGLLTHPSMSGGLRG